MSLPFKSMSAKCRIDNLFCNFSFHSFHFRASGAAPAAVLPGSASCFLLIHLLFPARSCWHRASCREEVARSLDKSGNRFRGVRRAARRPLHSPPLTLLPALSPESCTRAVLLTSGGSGFYALSRGRRSPGPDWEVAGALVILPVIFWHPAERPGFTIPPGDPDISTHFRPITSSPGL